MIYHKWTFFLTCFMLLILTACDKTPNCSYSSHSYGLVSTASVDELLVPEYAVANSVVFVNAKGETQSFTIKKNEGLSAQEVAVRCFEQELSHSYEFNASTYCLEAESGLTLDVFSYLEATPSMGELAFTEKLFVFSGKTDTEEGNIIRISIPEVKGELIEDARFTGSVNLLDKQFESCYVHQQSNASFNRLYYNQEVGVVAFDDAHNQLWVFDQFK